MRGKAEAAGGKLGHDLGLPERACERQALKPLFKRPGGIQHGPRLDDEKTGRVEAESHEAMPVRVSPFARGTFSEAPKQEFPARPPTHSSNHGKGESERGRGIAVGGGLDLVQPGLVEPMQRRLGFRRGSTKCPSPLVGEGRFAPARSAGMANREGGTFFRNGENGCFTPLRAPKGRACSPTRGERDCLDVRELKG